jgi:hypothetical protein
LKEFSLRICFVSLGLFGNVQGYLVIDYTPSVPGILVAVIRPVDFMCRDSTDATQTFDTIIAATLVHGAVFCLSLIVTHHKAYFWDQNDFFRFSPVEKVPFQTFM